jgi:hypothetical protein
MYCEPSEVYITDIHEPTLSNAVYNIHLNFGEKHQLNQSNKYETEILYSANRYGVLDSSSDYSCSDNQQKINVKKVDWGNRLTYPHEEGKTEILIGSDLVYEDRVVDILVQAISFMLSSGGSLFDTFSNSKMSC